MYISLPIYFYTNIVNDCDISYTYTKKIKNIFIRYYAKLLFVSPTRSFLIVVCKKLVYNVLHTSQPIKANKILFSESFKKQSRIDHH